MLPEDWKKEIQETVDKATRAASEANQRANEIQKEISGRIDAVANALNKYNEKQEREEPSKKTKDRWTLVALAGAAVFTLGLDLLSSCQLSETRKVYEPIKESADAAKTSASGIVGQVGIMQGQLDEMRRQRELTIIQLSPSFKRGFETARFDANFGHPNKGEPFVGWNILVKWTNGGATAAKDFLSVFKAQAFDAVFDAPLLVTRNCPAIGPFSHDSVKPVIIRAGDSAGAGPRSITVEDVTAARNHQKFILLWGRIEYHDFFGDTPLHHLTWCQHMVPDPDSSDSDNFGYRDISETAE